MIIDDAMIALNNATRTVVSTEEGGVLFFWHEVENRLSIEVEPSGALYIHTTDLSAGAFAEYAIPASADGARVLMLTADQAVAEIGRMLREVGMICDELEAQAADWRLDADQRGALQDIRGLEWLLAQAGIPASAADTGTTNLPTGPPGDAVHRRAAGSGARLARRHDHRPVDHRATRGPGVSPANDWRDAPANTDQESNMAPDIEGER